MKFNLFNTSAGQTARNVRRRGALCSGYAFDTSQVWLASLQQRRSALFRSYNDMVDQFCVHRVTSKSSVVSSWNDWLVSMFRQKSERSKEDVVRQRCFSRVQIRNRLAGVQPGKPNIFQFEWVGMWLRKYTSVCNNFIIHSYSYTTCHCVGLSIPRCGLLEQSCAWFIQVPQLGSSFLIKQPHERTASWNIEYRGWYRRTQRQPLQR